MIVLWSVGYFGIGEYLEKLLFIVFFVVFLMWFGVLKFGLFMFKLMILIFWVFNLLFFWDMVNVVEGDKWFRWFDNWFIVIIF